MSIPPYKMRSGEVWGDETPQTPSPLPDVARTGEKLVRRAKRAKSDPDWRDKTTAQRDLAVRADALSDRQVRG